MPSALTYPGVYIEEISSGVHTITGVATSITAFVGYTSRGLDNRAQEIFSFADFERSFGGLAADSELSYAVQQFFNNGGNDAIVVRVPKNNNAAAITTAVTAATTAATAKAAADAALAADPGNVALQTAATNAATAKTAADAATAAEKQVGSAPASITLLDGSGGKKSLAFTARAGAHGVTR
jgi:phage tail sheath protein FI